MPVTAKILANEPVSGVLRRLTLQMPPGWTFQAGQFVIVPVPQRAEDAKPPKGFYSIASSTRKLPTLELLVEHRPEGGYVSGWVSALSVGAQVDLEGPMGHFALNATKAPKVFIGAEAGLAPLRSMLLSSLDGGAEAEHWLLLGGSQALAAEWQDLAAAQPRFYYHPLSALSAEAVLAELPAPAGLEFYLAGFSRDLDPLKAGLIAAGIPAESIKAEKFG